eukprot:366049-Chlamydomonas_euryale.AAC.6
MGPSKHFNDGSWAHARLRGSTGTGCEWPLTPSVRQVLSAGRRQPHRQRQQPAAIAAAAAAAAAAHVCDAPGAQLRHHRRRSGTASAARRTVCDAGPPERAHDVHISSHVDAHTRGVNAHVQVARGHPARQRHLERHVIGATVEAVRRGACSRRAGYVSTPRTVGVSSKGSLPALAWPGLSECDADTRMAG